MKLVIDIDTDLYTRLFDNGEEYTADMRRACVAIRKGTVLPEGHGRLIDADAIDLSKYNRFCDAIDNALTIIEADKEGEEE